jgi:hypothetical protein
MTVSKITTTLALNLQDKGLSVSFSAYKFFLKLVFSLAGATTRRSLTSRGYFLEIGQDIRLDSKLMPKNRRLINYLKNSHRVEASNEANVDAQSTSKRKRDS